LSWGIDIPVGIYGGAARENLKGAARDSTRARRSKEVGRCEFGEREFAERESGD